MAVPLPSSLPPGSATFITTPPRGPALEGWIRDGGIAHHENSRNLGKEHDQPAFHTAPREMKLPAGCFGAKYDDRSSLSNEMLGGVLQKVAKIDVSATVRMHASHAIFFAKPF